MPAPEGSSHRGARRTAVLLAGLTAVLLTGCIEPPAETVDAAGGAPSGAAVESALEHDVRATFDNPWERVAVAVIDGDGVEEVFVEADDRTVYEIGSMTMALTGELLAMAVDRGEVALDDPLGAYLPLGDAPAATVTLESLATHSSGLPTNPSNPETAAAIEAAAATHANPFDYTLEELLELARLETLTEPGRSRYSYFGAALLGHALAAAAETDYESLLGERLLEPFDMGQAVLVDTLDEVPDAHAGGHYVDGSPVEPWAVAAYGPSLGVDATLPDLIALARAVLDGPMSESAALEPAVQVSTWPTSTGLLWELEEQPARTITYTIGFTGGFSAGLMLDREAGHASIVMVNSDTDVDEIALRYLLRFADG